jgi:predicted TIM-barrel fold metal-dependent hydrolase
MAKRGFMVMDSDLHTMESPDIWDRYLDEPFKKFIPDLIGQKASRAQNGQSAPTLHPHYAAARKRGYDPHSHLQAMDIEGVDVAILYGTRGRHVQMRDQLDPPLAAALARAHNNYSYDFCAANPSRLKFAAQISFHDVPMALQEACRAVSELGAVAIIGNPNPVNGRHIHDPYFEPLWQMIEELGVPVGFHPTGVWSLRDNIARRFTGHPNGSLIAIAAHNPVEVMLGFASLAGGGVLERHPKLRCAFLEGTCGWLPWWLWRMDETWEKFGPGTDAQLSALPSEYFRRQCFVGTEPDEKMLRHVVEEMGDQNIVFATDYPHRDGLFPEAVNSLLAMEGVDDQSKARILWDNCSRLYAQAIPRVM